MQNMFSVVDRYDQINAENFTVLSSTYGVILYREKMLQNILQAVDNPNMPRY